MSAAPAPDTKGTPSIQVADRTPAPGQRITVTGRAQGSYQQPLALQYRPAGATGWTDVGTTSVGRGDRFAVKGAVPASGRLRVSVTPPGATAPVASREVAVTLVKGAQGIAVRGKRLHVKQGRTARVRGAVKPGQPGVPAKLQVRRDGAWRTVDRATSRSNGRFVVKMKARRTMSAPARVVAGGRTRKVGRLNVYRFAGASWYGPGLYGGQLACGGTLNAGTVGVANKTLPCGTKVTLRHGGRTLRVRVIDRGPYVGGREYDLTAATAQRLGFTGSGAILATR